MRILFIDPPYDRLIGFKSEWFPLGLTCIASFLIEKGFDKIGIYDAEHDSYTDYISTINYSERVHKYKEAIDSTDHLIWNEARGKISHFQPDIVGLSVLSAKTSSAIKIAEICKDIDPNIKVVCGGHHPTVRPAEILCNENIDFVVRGEGEFTIYELLKALQSSTYNYYAIPGLSFKWKGEIIHNEDRKLIKDLNLLPIPSRDKLLDIELFSSDQLSMVMGSRGCPYNCGFCGSKNIWGRKVRYRSIDSILVEIDDLRKKYSVKNVILWTDPHELHRSE